MGFEDLNWFIFLLVAGVTASVGSLALIRVRLMGLPDRSADQDKGALRALQMTIAAVCVAACGIALQLLLPQRLRTASLSGVQIDKFAILIEYWSVVAILAIALMAARRSRGDLGFEIRIVGWVLLIINLVGGALFLISQRNT